MSAKQMPKIDLDKLSEILTADEFEIVKGIISTKGKNKGCLRASKPKVAKMVRKPRVPARWEGDYTLGFKNDEDAKTGMTAYVWRMVAFSVSPHHQHQCMPCTADFSIPGTWSEKKDEIAKLDAIVEKVTKTIPVTEWHGVRRWGQALGQIGTPQVSQDGAIIYR